MSIYRRRLMIANALKKSDSNINYPGLIAAWSAKGKSNDDVDRAVLRDLTGNGHDLTLNNFAFSRMSGYGGYNVDFLTLGRISKNVTKRTSTKIIVNGKQDGYILYRNATEAPSFKVKLTGLVTEYAYVDENDVRKTIGIGEGVHVLPKSHASSTVIVNCGFLNPVTSQSTENGIIELLPEYPDALVFDGVDDYGINSKMPILTDYTLIVKREILDDFSVRCMVASYKGNPTIEAGPFWFEYTTDTARTYSFGKRTSISLNKLKFVSYQTKSKYNGKDLSFGDSLSSGKRITIGGFYDYRSIDINMAFYSAYLFDRSLDEQEIKAFIRKYIDADYLLPSEIPTPDCYYDFTNGDNTSETRKTIIDLSGNGNDAKANNFAWNEEGSGYKDGALQFDGADDNIALLNPKKFRTVFIVAKWETNRKMIYGQRDMSVLPGEQNNAIYTQSQAYRARNIDGITYLNGKKNTHVGSESINDKKHCITEIFTNTGTDKCTGTVIGASTGPQHFMKMSLYKFLAFKEELTEAQIQYVIEKYNLLNGVDKIEVS